MSEKQELNSFENLQVSRHAQFCITIRIAAKYCGRVKIATHKIVTTQLTVATISATNFKLAALLFSVNSIIIMYVHLYILFFGSIFMQIAKI